MANTPQLDLIKETLGSTSWKGDEDDNKDKIDAAFHPSTGHDHSGATGKGPNLATSSITGLAEFIRDTLGAALVQGSRITITVNDGADTITIASDDTAEAEFIRDTIGAALVQGTGITVTVDDAGNTLTIASTITQYTNEMVDDRVAALLVEGSNITLTYDDTANTLTIASTVGGGSGDAVDIAYDNIVSGASETNVQDALDYLYANGGGGVGGLKTLSISALNPAHAYPPTTPLDFETPIKNDGAITYDDSSKTFTVQEAGFYLILMNMRKGGSGDALLMRSFNGGSLSTEYRRGVQAISGVWGTGTYFDYIEYAEGDYWQYGLYNDGTAVDSLDITYIKMSPLNLGGEGRGSGQASFLLDFDRFVGSSGTGYALDAIKGGYTFFYADLSSGRTVTSEKFDLLPGDYIVHAIVCGWNSSGILSMALDGNDLATAFDTYVNVAGGGSQVQHHSKDITVPDTRALHTLVLTMPTKNGASGGYGTQLGRVWFEPVTVDLS